MATRGAGRVYLQNTNAGIVAVSPKGKSLLREPLRSGGAPRRAGTGMANVTRKLGLWSGEGGEVKEAQDGAA